MPVVRDQSITRTKCPVVSFFSGVEMPNSETYPGTGTLHTKNAYSSGSDTDNRNLKTDAADVLRSFPASLKTLKRPS